MGLALPALDLSKLEMSPFSELKFLLENSQIPYKFRKIRVFSGLRQPEHISFKLLNFYSKVT